VHRPLAAAQLTEDPDVCRPWNLERARLRARGGQRIGHRSGVGDLDLPRPLARGSCKDDGAALHG